MDHAEEIFTVFLVEDSPIIRDRLCRLINSEPGIKVVGTAAGANESRAALATTTPDAVIIDISLQDGDGFDVLSIVNGIQPKPLTIMLTNYTYMSYRVRGLSEGAQYFFDKTTEFDDVIGVLKRYAGKQTAEPSFESSAISIGKKGSDGR